MKRIVKSLRCLQYRRTPSHVLQFALLQAQYAKHPSSPAIEQAARTAGHASIDMCPSP